MADVPLRDAALTDRIDATSAAGDLQAQLAALTQQGRYRRMRVVEGAQGPSVYIDGKQVTLLCSNDYLGLAEHPRVRAAAAQAAQRWGAGAGASRLVSGSMVAHRELEQELAVFERAERCVLFGSGYLANIGVIGALAGRGDVIYSDELNHASIVDGCRLSRADVVVYKHGDVEHLAACLQHHGRAPRARAEEEASAASDSAQPHDRRQLVVTDSVFSMDGDLAPLRAIVEIARASGARVVVDEAHATGTLGPGGRGAIAAAGLEGEVDVTIGTLSKALGSYGAYACGSASTVRYLVNFARSLIFSTALPPHVAAASLAALRILQAQPQLVEQLHTAARALREALQAQGFSVAAGEMHIVPLVVRDEHSALSLCERALELGVFAQAIRPPTVPVGTSRLRLAAMASHSPDQLRDAAAILKRAAIEVGLHPAAIGEAA